MHYVTDGKQEVWEGIHWVIDLLPRNPMLALDVIKAFYIAYMPYLTDSMLTGIDDAMVIIRWRYIVAERSRLEPESAVRSLTKRQFEYLVAIALEQEKCETYVTPSSKDGGVDIWLRKLPQIRRGAVQCKHAEVVGVEVCRELLHEADAASANVAIVATSGRFTKGARDKHADIHRLRLIDGSEVISLLNGGYGPDWPMRIDRIIAFRSARDTSRTLPNWLPKRALLNHEQDRCG